MPHNQFNQLLVMVVISLVVLVQGLVYPKYMAIITRNHFHLHHLPLPFLLMDQLRNLEEPHGEEG